MILLSVSGSMPLMRLYFMILASRLKVSLGLEDPLQRSRTHTWLASQSWLFAGGFIYCPWEPLSRAACLSSQRGFPVSDQKRAKRKSNVFYVLILEFMLHDFHHILLVILVCSIQCWRGLHKGMNTRNQETWESMLEAGYHTLHQISFPPIYPYSVTESYALAFKYLSHCMITCSFNYFSLSPSTRMSAP